MGLSVSDAVRILLKRVVNDRAFPLELKVPNSQTRALMEEARGIAKANAARFDSVDALINDLEKARKHLINSVMTVAYFDRLGVPRLS